MTCALRGKRGKMQRERQGKEERTKHSPDTRSLDIVSLEYVFSWHNVLNDHSHSTNVIQVMCMK